MFIHIKHLRTISSEETGDMNRMRRETNEKEEEEEEEKRKAITRKRERESKNVSP